jgi:spore coat protein U-like protein
MSATTVAFNPDYDFTDVTQHTNVVTSLKISGVVSGCSYLVGAEGAIAGRSLSDGSGHTMNYQLYTNSPLTNVFLDPVTGDSGTASNMVSFAGGDQSIATLTYYFSIPPGQYIPSGLYQDNVLLTLYGGTFLHPSMPIASLSASHQATVRATALLSLVPTGNAFDPNQTSTTMDFGTLVPGQSMSIQALFKSNDNTGYKVYMRSDNGSSLKQVGGAATIPYSLALSPSNSPNLTNVVPHPTLTTTDMQVASSTGVTPSTADRLNVSATVGSFSAPVQSPGVYSDVITVTIVGN